MDSPELIYRSPIEEPFSLHGVFFDRETGYYRRLPLSVACETSPGVRSLSKDTAGGRIRFATDSQVLAVRVRRAKHEQRPHMPPLV